MKQHILLTKRHFKNFCSFFLSLLSQTSSHISWTAACPCHAEYNRSVREMSGNKVSADSHLSPGCIPQFPFFSIQGSPLIAAQPLGIHIVKQAGKCAADHLFQWHTFQLCQCFIAVAEDPVYCTAFFIEYHLDVCKSKGKFITDFIIFVIFLIRPGQIMSIEFIYHQFLFFPPLQPDCLSSSHGKVNLFAIAQIDFIFDIRDCGYRHNTTQPFFTSIQLSPSISFNS